jgi:hypothetical protein
VPLLWNFGHDSGFHTFCDSPQSKGFFGTEGAPGRDLGNIMLQRMVDAGVLRLVSYLYSAAVFLLRRRKTV